MTTIPTTKPSFSVTSLTTHRRDTTWGIFGVGRYDTDAAIQTNHREASARPETSGVHISTCNDSQPTFPSRQRAASVRFSALLAIGAISVASLTGCVTRVVDVSGDKPQSTAPASSDGTPESTQPSNDGGTESSGDPTRAQYADQIDQTWPCEPEHPLTIDSISQVIEITGDCGEVTVSGHGLVVLADSIEDLTITGEANILLIDSIKKVVLTGNGNDVLWTQNTPTSDDSGINNVLRKTHK